MEKRTTIRLNDKTIGILNEAKGIWPEHAASQSALIRMVISDWWRNRGEVGGKSDLLYALLYVAMLDSGLDVEDAKAGAIKVKAAWRATADNPPAE